MGVWIPIAAMVGFAGLVLLFAWLAGRSQATRQRAQLEALSRSWNGRPVHEVTALGYADPAPGFEVTVNGRPAVVFARRSGRYGLFGFQLAVGPLPLAYFRRERGLDRLGRALRLNREVQIGDAAFDHEVYIETDEDEAAIRAMLASPEVRAAVRQAARHGRGVVTSREGVGVTVSAVPGAKLEASFNAALPDVQAVADALPRAPGGAGVRRRARGDLAAAGAVFALFGAYVLYITAQWTKPDLWEPWLDRDGKAATRVAAIAFLALLLGSYVWMRGHSRSLRNFAATTIFGGWAMFGVVPIALWMLNASLDHSAPVAHDTTVFSQHTRSTRNYTHHVLVVHPLFHPTGTSSLEVSSGLYYAVHPGDHVRVMLRDGAFGWKWVSSIERATPGG